MKKAYETPSAEALEFNYADVVVASVTEPELVNQVAPQCGHAPGGYSFEDNHSCEKDPDRDKNNKCYPE